MRSTRLSFGTFLVSSTLVGGISKVDQERITNKEMVLNLCLASITIVENSLMAREMVTVL